MRKYLLSIEQILETNYIASRVQQLIRSLVLMASKTKEISLGDGLYAYDSGFDIQLRAPRTSGDHWVGLDDHTLDAFLEFLESSRNLKIEVKKLPKEES